MKAPAAKRLARGFFLGGACALGGLLLLQIDVAPLIDRFYEQQVESKAVAVWKHSAVAVSYDQCRADVVSCLGRTVLWPVSHPVLGDSRYQDDASRPLIWRNEAQVPERTVRGHPFQAVARVVAVHPHSIELIYLGTPQAVYGGTTWKGKFGLDAPAGPPPGPLTGPEFQIH